LGRIGFIFTDNSECLLAAVIPAQGDCRPEFRLILTRPSLDNFRACVPRSPVSHFAESCCGGLFIAFIDGRPVSRLKTPECVLDRPQAFALYELR
jgi:hypothetical protein